MATKTVMGRFSAVVTLGGNVFLGRTHEGAIKNARRKGYLSEDVAMIHCTVFGRMCSRPPFKMTKEHHLALKQTFSGLLANSNGKASSKA